MSQSSPPSPPTSCLSSVKKTLEGLLYSSSSATTAGSAAPATCADRKDPLAYSPAFPMDVKAQPAVETKPPALEKDAKILIFGGGGTMGSSTALHLARRGYTDITVLDEFEIPSRQSAGVRLSVPPSSPSNPGLTCHPILVPERPQQDRRRWLSNGLARQAGRCVRRPRDRLSAPS
jgi:hypothetical protein